MKGIIDRFEGDLVVIEFEGKVMKNIPRNLMPKEAREGDVIILKGEAYLLDTNETNQRKEKIDKLIDDLWE